MYLVHFITGRCSFVSLKTCWTVKLLEFKRIPTVVCDWMNEWFATENPPKVKESNLFRMNTFTNLNTQNKAWSWNKNWRENEIWTYKKKDCIRICRVFDLFTSKRIKQIKFRCDVREVLFANFLFPWQSPVENWEVLSDTWNTLPCQYARVCVCGERLPYEYCKCFHEFKACMRCVSVEVLVRPDGVMTHDFFKLPHAKTKPKIDTS